MSLFNEVANFEKGRLTVDTCGVADADKPFETGISHPAYNDGDWVIVQLYKTKATAIRGHKKWVKLMTAKKLPKELKNVSTTETAKMVNVVANGEDWRTHKLTSKE